MNSTFFATPSRFRGWLVKHHDSDHELWVGFYKKSSGKASITWAEAVDAALCFGWVDSVRKSIDDLSYTNRFTPRRPRSSWSTRNVKRVNELTKLGLMHPAGLKAFEARTEEKSGTYSYEQRHLARLENAGDRRFRANKRAWDYFQKQVPSYRQAAIWWVMSAKKEETRRRRLDTLIEDSGRGRTIPPLTRPTKPK